MSARRLVVAGLSVGTAALLAVACGGSSPTGPSASTGVRVEGTVLDGSAGTGVVAHSGTAAATSGPVTVTVKEEPSLSVTVSGSGTFELEGLPDGAFTLVFARKGVALGEVPVTGASGGETVKVVVRVDGRTVALVQLDIDGPGALASPSPRPSPSPSPSPAATCAIAGGTVGQPIELEGHVAELLTSPSPGPAFRMDVNGNRSEVAVTVDASKARFQCVGTAKDGSCPSQLQVGAMVHVSGSLKSCTTGATAEATVEATGVKIQKK
jgi:hypothetical protein